MDVGVLTMEKLFGKTVRYQIPTFQRPYVWRKEDQWQPLWDDVRNTAESYIEDTLSNPETSRRRSIHQSRAHFLGAVVVQQQHVAAGEIESRTVIDGQQRLTTAQLLLDAVQEVMETRGHSRIAKRLSLLVLNHAAFVEEDDDFFKVWPTLTDRDAFRHAMHNGLPTNEFQNSLIVQAHEFFRLEVDHWLAELPEETDVRADALEKAVAHLLELVVIDLSVDDEPHIIFETLNARGTPLLQSDLIKNMILYQADQMDIDSDSNEARELWDFSDDWWREEVRRGRLTDPRIDVFLYYWLTMRGHQEIRPDRVAAEFRRYSEGSPARIEEIAADMKRVGATYRALEDGEANGYETFLYRREVMQAGVLTPVLLWLFSSDMSAEQREQSIRALESYMVRRMVCRMTTQNYNALFLGLINELENSGPSSAGDTVVSYLSGQTAHANLWPDDREVEKAFVELPLYWSLTRGRLRIVLEGIEEQLRTPMAESQEVPRGLTIEHIMPQKWQENWPFPVASTDSHEAVARHENRNRIIHSIGNLTLVNFRLNPSLSNASWPCKRLKLDEHAVLFLNKKLLQEAPDEWNEDAIAERSLQLAKLASRAWPSAQEF